MSLLCRVVAFFGIVASGLFGDVACSLGRDLARSCLSHGAYLCLMLQVVNVFVTGASRYTNLFGGFLLVCTMKLNAMHDVERMVVLSFLWYMSACLKESAVC